jgi:hypothetical protein
MGLKDWLKVKPYWLKGGVIGALIAFIFTVVLLLLSLAFMISVWMGGENIANLGTGILFTFAVIIILIIFLNFIYIPADMVIKSLGLGADTSLFVAMLIYGLIGIVYYFIAGSIIGWITGKIKGK